MTSFYYQLGSTYAGLQEWTLAIPSLEDARRIRFIIEAEQTLIDCVDAALRETEEQKTPDINGPELPKPMHNPRYQS